MIITLENYVKENYPDIVRDYQLMLKGWNYLKVGMKLKMFFSGYGGPAGVIRVIRKKPKDKFSRFLELSPINDLKSISLVYEKKSEYRNTNWWQEFEILKEEE